MRRRRRRLPAALLGMIMKPKAFHGDSVKGGLPPILALGIFELFFYFLNTYLMRRLPAALLGMAMKAFHGDSVKGGVPPILALGIFELFFLLFKFQ